MTISIAYSPDADDAFMFWALQTGRIPTSCELSFTTHDTETLNQLAVDNGGRYDVSAVSIGALPKILEHYRLLPHGGSIGDNYGPVVVERPDSEGVWSAGPVAIPGEHTTAALVLRLLYPDIPTVEVPITPFQAAFDCLVDGRARASLLIHEGRLTFERLGHVACLDLGQAWHQETGLPLPLGGNVIRRSLDPALQRELELAIGRSIQEALAHRDEAIAWLLDQKLGNLDNPTDVDVYLDLYANDDTAETPARAVQAIGELLTRAKREGLVPQTLPIDEIDGSFFRSR